MRTKIQGLSQTTEPSPLIEGSYRARVVRFGPAGHAAKPCLAATFLIRARPVCGSFRPHSPLLS